MAIREGKWKCRQCGEVSRARDMSCASCGAVRPGDIAFFLEEDAPEVTDAAVLARAGEGPDWTCAYCEQSNRASAGKCSSCGADRSEGKARAAGQVTPVGQAVVSDPRRRDAPTSAPPLAQPPLPHAGVAGPAAKGVKGCCGLVLTLMMLGVCLLFAVAGLRGTPTYSVGQVAWRRSFGVERWDTVKRTDWVVPEGGRVLEQRQAVRSHETVKIGEKDVVKTRRVQTGTRQVPVSVVRREKTGTRQVPYTVTTKVKVGTKKVKTGVRDKGNGFFEDVYKDVPIYEDRRETKYRTEDVYENRTHTEYRTEPVYEDQKYTEKEPITEQRPVYATQYTFEVEEWVFDHDETREGRDLSPAWPELALPAEGAKRLRERPGSRREAYSVELAAEGQPKRVYAPRAVEEFARFAPGSRWKLRLQGNDVLDATPEGK